MDYVAGYGYDEYYAGCGEAYPNASITYVENGIAKTKESVPAEKIINAPFYTRVWESTGEGTESIYSDYGTAGSMGIQFRNRAGVAG